MRVKWKVPLQRPVKRSCRNIFIWFLCAIGFLKVSQKIDSFMASLGVHVGRTGGSMLAELMVAGRGIATAAGCIWKHGF
jgi:hypothetical protein